MDKKRMVWDLWIKRMFNALQALNEQRHLYSISSAFISLMPIMIAGAYATVVNNMPVPAYQQFMESVFGEGWRLMGALIFNATTQIAAIFVTYQISMNLAAWYNTNCGRQINGGICGMTGLGSYVAVSIPVSGADSLPFAMDGVTGLFVAMIVSVAAGEIFIKLGSRKNIMDILSDDTNAAVPQSLASIMPAAITLIIFCGFRIILAAAGAEPGLSDIVNEALRAPFQNSEESVSSGFLYILFTHIMWLFGIHGNNVLDGVAQSVFVPALEANTAAIAAGAAPPNLITKTMLDVFVHMGGSGVAYCVGGVRLRAQPPYADAFFAA